MRTAPAVRLTLAADRGWRAAVAVVAATAAGSCAAWIAGWAGALALASGAAVAVSALLVGAVAFRLAASAAGVLAWDGAAWSWRGDEGDLACAMDLGPWLLLRWEPWPSRRRCPVVWLPVSRAAAGPAWHALRAAVYCRRLRNRASAASRTMASTEPE